MCQLEGKTCLVAGRVGSAGARLFVAAGARVMPADFDGDAVDYISSTPAISGLSRRPHAGTAQTTPTVASEYSLIGTSIMAMRAGAGICGSIGAGDAALLSASSRSSFAIGAPATADGGMSA